MVTAPAIPRSRTILHTRATWSARDDRTASAVWLGVWWVGLIAGFAVDFRRYLAEKPAAHWIVHVHAAIFTVWTLLITAQVLLVVGDRVSWHRKLGWVLAGWACLMGIMGPLAGLAADVVNVHGGPVYDPPFFSVQLENIACFVALVAWGIALRNNAAAHRRIMILTTVAIADPGFSRFTGWIWPQEPQSILLWFAWLFYGNVLMILLMAAWDWYRGRLMRQFVFGAAALLSAEIAATVLYFWTPWRTFTTNFVVATARHFGY